MTIYKEPTIYKQGIGKDDVEQIILDANRWINITSKVGSFNSSIFNNSGAIYIFYNPLLLLIRIFGYGSANSSLSKNSNHKIFNFNSDLPGDNSVNLFSGDTLCRIKTSTSANVSIMSMRPYNDPNPAVAYSLAIGANGVLDFTTADGINVFTTLTKSLVDDFNTYLGL